MAKKPALGRGLGAILPDYEDQADRLYDNDIKGSTAGASHSMNERQRKIGSISEIPIDAIDPNPYQPRSDFDSEALDELADSIRELGIVQPITVRTSSSKRYELISGERRLRAARRAGLQRIPAYLVEADTEAMLEMALVENVQRKDLNPVEVAIGYERLLTECGLTHEELSKKVGKSRSSVTNTLRLLKLSPGIQLALQQNTIKEGHARALAMVESEAAQRRLLERIVKDELSVRAVERLARQIGEKKEEADAPRPDPIRQVDPHVEAVTDQLRRIYGTRVSIHNKKGGAGKIELDYFSSDELERLLDLLLRS